MLLYLRTVVTIFVVSLAVFEVSVAADSGEGDAQQGWWSQFKDPVDNKFDMSQWLIENAYGFLPVPVIITEPSVDNGLGMAGVFFHKPKADDRKPAKGEIPVTDISAVAAAYTGNDSWFAGGGHFNTWKQDTRRYIALLGYADVNLDFYGSGGQLPGDIEKAGFNAKGLFVDQLIEFRVAQSDWFLGAGWRYLNADISVNSGTALDELLSGDVTLSALEAVVLYEDLDSRFSPSRGFKAQFKALWNSDAIGSDVNYNQLNWELRQYFTFKDTFSLAWRFDGATTDGDTPFFLEPYVNIEGIPALRYQGPTVATAELRGGWEFVPRWSVIAFVGGGRTADNFGDLFSATTRTSVGTGFRYLLARQLGLRVGLDVARGPEDTYVYLVMGSAWSRGL
jgi:hypothetical protein